jgi:hypothetical protein
MLALSLGETGCVHYRHLLGTGKPTRQMTRARNRCIIPITCDKISYMEERWIQSSWE